MPEQGDVGQLESEDEIEVVFDDYDSTDEAPKGNLTPDDQEGDCAGEDGD
jgi:hypothetical protein